MSEKDPKLSQELSEQELDMVAGGVGERVNGELVVDPEAPACESYQPRNPKFANFFSSKTCGGCKFCFQRYGDCPLQYRCTIK